MLPRLVVALSAVLLSKEAPLAPPVVPAAIAAPAGAKLARRLHATGFQIYACAAAAPSTPGTPPTSGAAPTFAWKLARPDAKLVDAAGAAAGTHGAGPNWTAKDGSAVIGEKVAQADAPAPDAVPWLLLRAKSNSGAGAFAHVTFVQRVNTKGGKAAATGCDAKAAGQETRVPYEADYLFFEGGAPAK